MRILLLHFLLLFLLPSEINAQLCQGSLGPAIRHTTFGSGSNPGAPLLPGSTNYSYTTADCPPDGSYTIRNNSNACYGGTWHTLNTDHTGDPNGYFMLVNASFTAGDFYVDTVRGLCAGTTFEFAAWVINVIKPGFCSPPILPNLTFRIERTDGSLIQTYSTGDIASVPVVQWQQIGFFFTTPAGVSDVVLRITNNAPGGCGNDLALDDITFRPCGPQLTPSITGQSNTSVSYCQGPAGTYLLQCNVSAGFTSPAYQWQQSINGGAFTDVGAATNTSFSVFIPAGSPASVYSYRMLAAEAGNIANPSCRIASNVLSITIDSLPIPVINTNSPLCAGQNLTLNGNGGGLYTWNGPGGFTANIAATGISSANTSATGRYYLQVATSAGCTSIDSADILVHPSPSATVTFANAVICQGAGIQLGASGGNNYTWSPGTGLSSVNIANPIATPAQNTSYMVVVANSFNCTDTAYIQLQVQNTAYANAGADKVTIAGHPVQLSGQAGGDNISYQWLPATYLDDDLILNPTLQNIPPGEYLYTLTVTSACGTATDAVKVVVYRELYIPTAFTPNNDGLNDRWQIQALVAFKEVDIVVYNRYGIPVYKSKGISSGWDGTYNGELQPGGTYVYQVVVQSQAGKQTYKGTVNLIR